MLSTVLVPIIKDKTGRIDRMDNYRPIALASVMSKVVEIIILNRISKLLKGNCIEFRHHVALRFEHYFPLLSVQVVWRCM